MPLRKRLKEAIVSTLSNDGSDVAVEDNLDLQSSNEVKNASAVSTGKANITNVAARVAKGGSDQTATDGSVAKVAWDTTDIEDTDVFTVDLSNDEISVDVDGTYMASGSLNFDKFKSQDYQLDIRVEVNGSREKLFDGSGNINSNGRAFSVPLPAVVLDLSANDSISVTVLQSDSGGNNQTIRAKAARTYLNVVRVG